MRADDNGEGRKHQRNRLLKTAGGILLVAGGVVFALLHPEQSTLGFGVAIFGAFGADHSTIINAAKGALR